MASVNGVSSMFTNSYGITNKGTGGLLSGLDTDSLVEALTTSTRSKIAKQSQQKQLLQWKQTAYRDVGSTLRAFQNKRFTYSAVSTNNISSYAFFNTYVGQSTSAKVSLLANKTSATGSVAIDEIRQMASNEKITVAKKYGQDLTGSNVDFSKENFTFSGKSLQIQVGSGSTKTIRLDSLNEYVDQINALDSSDPSYDSDHADIMDNLNKEMQSLIDAAVGTRSASKAEIEAIEANAFEGNYTIRKDSGGNPVTDSDGNPIYDISIVNAKILRADPSGSKYNITLGAAQDTISVRSDCTALGLKNGQSNAIDKSAKLKDFFPEINNEKVSFKINGTLIELDMAKDTVASMMSKINNSAAGVTLDYNDRSKQFTFTSKTSGAGEGIYMQDVHGRFLNGFVGAYGSNNMTSVDNFYNYGNSSSISQANAALNTGTAGTFVSDNAGKMLAFGLTINGTTKNIYVNIGSDLGGKTAAKYLEDQVNSAIKDSFGSEPGVTFSLTSSGVSFNLSSYKTEVSLEQRQSGGGNVVDFLDTVGIADKTTNVGAAPGNITKLNTLDGMSTASVGTVTFEIDGQSFDVAWNGSENIKDFVERANTEAAATLGLDPSKFQFMSYKNGYIQMDAGANANGSLRTLTFDEVGDPLMEKIFGASRYDGSQDESKRVHTAGTNAEIVVDGRVLTSETNAFTVDGIAFEISDLSTEKITIGSKVDPDDLVSRITEFVNEYNGILETLYTLIYEKQEGSFPPLTDEQRSEMSDEQIKTWENEAKKGLLFNDRTLSNIVGELRNAMIGKVEAAGISLASIGIAPQSFLDNLGKGASYDYTKAGRLIVDEAKLRTAIENDPEAVRVLFTHKDTSKEATASDQGIAERLNTVLTKAASESSNEEVRGSLVRLAGTAGTTGNNTSELGTKISTIDKYISSLKIRLETEYSRHWKRFSSLETSLQRISAQSSWLSDFGS